MENNLKKVSNYRIIKTQAIILKRIPSRRLLKTTAIKYNRSKNEMKVMGNKIEDNNMKILFWRRDGRIYEKWRTLVQA